MKYTLLFCLLALSCLGQNRRNDPLPHVAKSSLKELDKEIIGWGKSLDNQWVSEKNIIPYRKLSRDESPDFNRSHELGMDNLISLQMIPVVYAEDTLICLVKHLETGYYKFERIEKSWEPQRKAFYFLLASGQAEKLNLLSVNDAEVIELELLDAGIIKNVKPGKVSKSLSEQIKVNPSCPRKLVVTAKTYQAQEEIKGELQKTPMIQFQIHSDHIRGRDLKAVVRDFKLKGNSLYGTPELLNYLYYECELASFKNLLMLDEKFKLLN